jgi:hypothetical protein
MPSDRAAGPLRDILHHIDLAERFVGGFDREAFKADLRTVYAITRCLEIISEASRRLPEALKERHPMIAWKQNGGCGKCLSSRLRRRCRPIRLGHCATGSPAFEGGHQRGNRTAKVMFRSSFVPIMVN